MKDIAIIGSGILGSLLAYQLSKYEVSVILIDKESDSCNGISLANSAIIHAGVDPEENTLKARHNVRGNQMYPALCEELSARYLPCGGWIVAKNEDELDALIELQARAQSRGIPCDWLDQTQVRQLQPNIHDSILAALSLDTTGVIYPWEVSHHAVSAAYNNGVECAFNHEVVSISKSEVGYQITTSKGVIDARIVINVAGLFADRIEQMVHEPSFSLHLRKGVYYVLDKKAVNLSKRVIYPAPSKVGKGVLIVPTLDGNMLIGPNSKDIDDPFDISSDAESLKEVKEKASLLLTDIPYHLNIRTFAGIRPTSHSKDFIIEHHKDDKCWINVTGVDSPGLASAPSIVESVIEEMIGSMLELRKKNVFKPYKPLPTLHALTDAQRNEYIAKNPKYGHVICVCEEISEQEILDAIKEPFGAKTVKQIKKRCRPGSGRCQGGMCEPKIVELIAKEYQIDVTDIRFDKEGSWMFAKEESQ